MNSPDFQELVRGGLTGYSVEIEKRVVRFYELLIEENTRQNLTRLIEPQEFWEGHVLDCLELMGSGLVSFPAMDLGSGGGVPGLLCAALGSGPWVLVESEHRKAEFLERARRDLGLETVRVVAGRAEEVLKRQKVESVVARAVGPVGRIYAWLRPCSTWNNLVLLKGPGWIAEWSEFQKTGRGRELKIEREHGYLVGAEKKERRILRITRAKK